MWILVFISFLYFLLIGLFVFVDSIYSKDVFSAVKTASYFFFIEAVVMLWFSLSPESIDSVIFAVVDAKYRDVENLVLAYLFSIFVYLFVMFGVVLGSYCSGTAPKSIGRLVFNLDGWERYNHPWFGLIILSFGVVVFVYFISKVGGLSEVWKEIHLRTQLTAGLGYLQALYTFSIVVGSGYLYVFWVFRKKYIRVFLMLVLSAGVLGALGQRSPVVLFLFGVLLLHHYRIKPLRKILNFKIVALAVLAIIFMYMMVQLRPGSEVGTVADKVERNVIQRLGVIERQVVVIGYFSDHDFFGSGIYQSLLYSFIPRSLYPDKPPIDTGMYLNHIRQGGDLVPPVPANSLEPSSWPDGYLAGYMSFGVFGFALISLFSGFVYGFIYKAMCLYGFSVPSVIIYAHAGFMGVKPLSPLGITQLMMVLVPFAVLGFIGRFRLGRGRARQ